MSIDPKALEPVFRQNWENARHIKSGRIWLLKAECEKRGVPLNVLASKAGGVAANSQLRGTGYQNPTLDTLPRSTTILQQAVGVFEVPWSKRDKNSAYTRRFAARNPPCREIPFVDLPPAVPPPACHSPWAQSVWCGWPFFSQAILHAPNPKRKTPGAGRRVNGGGRGHTEAPP